jgi:PEP-CTERM motif
MIYRTFSHARAFRPFYAPIWPVPDQGSVVSLRTINQRTRGQAMRFQILAASLLAISILSEPPAQADLVTVDFSGEVTNTVAAYAVETLYSGSFSYDPSVAPTMFDPPVFAWYPPTSFSLMIGSDTYVSTTGLIQTHGSAGGFSYAASLLSGNGPLAGGIFKVNFFGSSDPTLAANDLPGSFPTDFVATQAGYTLASDAAGGLTLVGDDSNIGSLTSYNQVPEPSSIVVLATGVMCLAAMIRRASQFTHPTFPAS